MPLVRDMFQTALNFDVALKQSLYRHLLVLIALINLIRRLWLLRPRSTEANAAKVSSLR